MLEINFGEWLAARDFFWRWVAVPLWDPRRERHAGKCKKTGGLTAGLWARWSGPIPCVRRSARYDAATATRGFDRADRRGKSRSLTPERQAPTAKRSDSGCLDQSWSAPAMARARSGLARQAS